MVAHAHSDAALGEPYGSSFEHLCDELARIDVLISGQVARARQAAGDDAWRGVAISEAEVDALLARPPGAAPWDAAPLGPSLGEAHAVADGMALAIEQRCARSSVPLALVELSQRFELTRFDVDAVLVALAPEIDLRYERLYGYLHDDVTRKRPSVDLALHLLCSFEQRWTARVRFAASAPLIRHRLIQLVADRAAPPLLAHTLKLDDRVVDWLHGLPDLEPGLARVARRIGWGSTLHASLDRLQLAAPVRERLLRLAAESVDAGTEPTAESASWRDPAVPADGTGVRSPSTDRRDRVAFPGDGPQVTAPSTGGSSPQPASGNEASATPPTSAIIYLRGPAGVGKRTTAEAFARALGRDVLALDCAALDGASDEVAEATVRAAAREARLGGDLLLCEAADLVLIGDRRAARAALIAVLAEAPGPCVLTGTTAWEPSDALRGRPFVQIEIGLPDAPSQVRLWDTALADASLDEDVDLAALAGRLRLSGGQIHDAAATARSIAHGRGGPGAPIAAADIAEACRRHTGRRFGTLARKVAARPAWDDLVLPPDRVLRLRELCDHARHRATVFERWGFDRRLPNGKGLGMLFAGAPGTGKTLAASVIATELGLELYQIDLASVVSKWLGETEKHLGKIFDEAERGHGVLLFDEADALFSKRSEVHDSHDRYANLETSYLLQRIEAYEGIVILASNFRRNLDDAFIRRLRFIVEFPLPEERERLRIWERIWPAETPLAPDLDLAYLARRFELAGAHLRNIALAAAFLAAAAGQPVSQRHVLHAARREYQKLGKMIDESAFGGRG